MRWEERGEERSETLWWHLGSVIPNRIVSYSEEETDRGRREKTTKTNKQNIPFQCASST